MKRAVPESTTGHRLLRWLTLLAACLALLAIGLLTALHLPAGQRFVLSRVATVLEAQEIEFSADQLRFNLFDLSLSLRDVSVGAAHREPEPPVAVIDQLDADISLLDLVRRRYVIESGTARGVTLHYVVETDGKSNLPGRAPDPESPGQPLDFLIDGFSIVDATLRYEDRARQIDVVVPVDEMQVNASRLTGRHDATVRGGRGRIRTPQREWEIDALTADLDLGDDDVTGRVALEAEGSRAEIEGGYHVGRGEIDAREVRLSGQWGRMTAAAVVSVKGGASSALLLPHDVNLAELLALADMSPTIASRLNGEIQASWPGLEYTATTGHAELTLTPVASRPSRSALPVSGHIEVNGSEGRLDAQISNASALGIRLGGRVSLAHQTTLSGTFRAEAGDLDASAAMAGAFLASKAVSALPISGTAVVTGVVGGTLSDPALRASLQVPELSLAGATGISARGDIGYGSNVVSVRSMDVAWGAARAHAGGLVPLDGRRLAVTYTAEGFDIPALLAAAGERRVRPASAKASAVRHSFSEGGKDPPYELEDLQAAEGTLSLSGKVRGTLSEPVATASLHGSGLSFLNERLGELAARVDATPSQLTLHELVLNKPQERGDGRLTARGRYLFGPRGYDVELHTDNLTIANMQLPDGRPLRGDFSLAASGSGTLDRPGGMVSLAVTGLRLAEYDLGAVLADASIANAQADVRLTAGRFSTELTGTVDTFAPYNAVFDARIDGLDLAALPVMFETPLTGRVSANIEGEGPLTDVRLARVSGEVEALDGVWNGQPFSVEAPAVVRYDAERVAIERLHVQARNSTLAISGTWPLATALDDGRLEVEARLDLATLAQYAPAGVGVSADGALLLEGTVRGNLAAVDPDLELTIDNGLVLGPAIDPGISDLDLRARITGGVATVEHFAGRWGTASIEAAARVPLSIVPGIPHILPTATGPATLVASLVGLSPAAVPGAPAGLSGRISANVSAASDRPELASVEGYLTFTELQVGFRNLELEQQQPSALTLESGTVAIDSFDLLGTAGTLRAAGTVGLLGTQPLDVKVNSALETAAATSSLTDALRVEGYAWLNAAATGTLSNPQFDGSLVVSDVMVAVDEPEITAERLAAGAEFAGERISLSYLSAEVNGGTVVGSGSLTIGGGELRAVDFSLGAEEFAFDAPLDLRSLSNSQLRLTGGGNNLRLTGAVTIKEAGLTGDVNFDTGLLATIAAPRALDLTEERNPLLESLAFDVRVDTETPILVDNNLARAEVTTDLRVVGTPYETGLSGSLTVLEGGEITLNERRYEVERGTVTFLDDRRIVPSFDLRLNTEAGNYDVIVEVSGEPGETETTLTSDPALPEPDIMALLVTGRTLDEMRGEEGDIAREQVLSYLVGRVGSSLGRTLERATGLSEVRLDPTLIAHETDPGARLTLGQDLTDSLKLVYSTDLANSNDEVWVARYDVTRRFQTSATRQADGSYRFDFRHDVRAGGRPAPARIARPRALVTTLNIDVGGVLSEAESRQRLGLTVGHPYDYFSARDGLRRIEEALQSKGRLQSRARLERRVEPDGIALTLRVIDGPLVEIRYDGASPPRRIDTEVRRQWNRGVFDSQRAGDAIDVLREWLIGEGHVSPTLDYRVEDAGADARLVTFNIQPGPRSRRILVRFDGAVGIAPDVLSDVIREQDLERDLFTDPLVVTELLRRFYREEGYLATRIDTPRVEQSNDQATVVIDVDEGPRFVVTSISPTGNTVVPAATILGEIPLVVGDPFLPAAAQRSLDRVRDLYWRRAYNDVRTEYELVIDREAGNVDVTLIVREGQPSVVADITIAGNEQTSDRLVGEQIELAAGDPLDLALLSRSRRNLYSTGAFSLVDVTREVEADPAPGGSTTPEASSAVPVNVEVAVREVQPFQIRYGASFDTERGLGGIVDVANYNSLGKARVVGLTTRYDARLREARLYASQPSLLYWPIRTTASVYYREERNLQSTLTNPFEVDRLGLSFQQERELGNSYVWTYGYRFERARKSSTLVEANQGETISVSPLTSTFTRETRDEMLDATRGSFTSHAFAYSPSWLGADTTYVKYYGQYFKYFALRPAVRKRFTGELLRPRLVYATGVRLGLAHGFGGPMPETERFYAGGSTTLRGFEQNTLGPIGPGGIPTGGSALLVLNNELRFPVIGPLDGVGFLDIGNVFGTVGDLSLAHLRTTPGIGVRVRTPWFLIRGDYGVALDPRPGEPRGRFYFSIGQAF